MHPRGKGVPCAYCRRPMTARGSRGRLAATKDHVVPYSHGGTVKVIACRYCNGLKSDLTPEQWAAFMRLYPRWWTMGLFHHGGMPLRIRILVVTAVLAASNAPPE